MSKSEKGTKLLLREGAVDDIMSKNYYSKGRPKYVSAHKAKK